MAYNRLLLPYLPSAPIEIGDYAVVNTNWDPESPGSYAVVSTNVDYKVPMGDAAISIPCRGISYINGFSPLPPISLADTANFYVESPTERYTVWLTLYRTYYGWSKTSGGWFSPSYSTTNTLMPWEGVVENVFENSGVGACIPVYIRIACSVALDYNGGEPESGQPTTLTCRAGRSVTLPASGIYAGKRLVSWSLSRDDQSSHRDYDGGAVVNLFPTPEHTFYTATANWLDATEVALDPNGGTCDVKKIAVFPGSIYGQLPTPTRDGYNFTGWSTTRGIDGLITSESIVPSPPPLRLYAIWSEAPVWGVRLNPTEGTLPEGTDPIVIKHVGFPYGDLPQPVAYGRTFLGWFTRPDGGIKITPAMIVPVEDESE